MSYAVQSIAASLLAIGAMSLALSLFIVVWDIHNGFLPYALATAMICLGLGSVLGPNTWS